MTSYAKKVIPEIINMQGEMCKKTKVWILLLSALGFSHNIPSMSVTSTFKRGTYILLYNLLLIIA